MLLIADYWQSGKPLPADDAILAKIAGVSKGAWAKIRPKLIAFFNERDGQWFHERVEKELAAAKQRYERRAAAGHKGGVAKAEQISSNATAGPYTGIGTEDKGQLQNPSKDFIKGLTSSLSGHSSDWTPEQKKAAWQSKILREVQRTLPDEQYQDFVVAWANDEPKARQLAEKIDAKLRREKVA